MKYLKSFNESRNNIDHKKVLKKILDIIFNNQLISKKIDENYYHLLKYDSDTNEEILVGAMTYHIREDNPFYDISRNPEFKYVIEIQDAKEVNDFDDPKTPIIDFDYIRLVPVDDNGIFSVNDLEKHLNQVYNSRL